MNQNQWLLIGLFAIVVLYWINSKYKLHEIVYDQSVGMNYVNTPGMSAGDKVNKYSKYLKRDAASNRINYMVYTFVGLLLLLMSYTAINGWFTTFNLAEASKSWLPISAKILDNNNKTFRQKGTNKEYFFASVNYEFEYKGEILTGGKLRYDNGWSSTASSVADEKARDLPKYGEIVTIYYDENTGRSVLYPGREGTSYRALVFALIMFSISLFLLYLASAIALIKYVTN